MEMKLLIKYAGSVEAWTGARRGNADYERNDLAGMTIGDA